MENPELYTVYNSMQKQDTANILKEFGPQMIWSLEEESVLDVGCGPGDVTAEIILPQLPPCASCIGVDINEHMIEFAKKKYKNDRLEFQILDFSITNITKILQEKSFTKIFSFYCLHWIQNQQLVARNIFSLLRPGGEFLILMSTNNNVFKVYKIMSEMEKWKPYMENLSAITPWFLMNPREKINKVWTSQGLEIITCEEREQTVSFQSKRVLMRSIEAINPFVNLMDEEIREEYLAAYEQIIEENQLTTETKTGEILVQNKIVVIYGCRPHTNPMAKL